MHCWQAVIEGRCCNQICRQHIHAALLCIVGGLMWATALCSWTIASMQGASQSIWTNRWRGCSRPARLSSSSMPAMSGCPSVASRLGAKSTSCLPDHETRNYHQSTNKAHAQVPHNLLVSRCYTSSSKPCLYSAVSLSRSFGMTSCMRIQLPRQVVTDLHSLCMHLPSSTHGVLVSVLI